MDLPARRARRAAVRHRGVQRQRPGPRRVYDRRHNKETHTWQRQITVALLAAFGSDDSESSSGTATAATPEESYCADADHLETSVDALESAVDAVSGDLTVSNGANVVVAVEDVAAAGQDVISMLETTCS